MAKKTSLAILMALPLLAGCSSPSAAVGPGTGSAPPESAAAAATPSPVASKGAAVTNAPSAEPTVITGSVGEPVTFEMYSGKVARMTILDVAIVNKVTDDPAATMAEPGNYLRINAVWESLKGETNLHAKYIEIRDDGSDSGSVPVVLLADGSIPYGLVEEGSSRSGYMYYLVRPGVPLTVNVLNERYKPVAVWNLQQ